MTGVSCQTIEIYIPSTLLSFRGYPVLSDNAVNVQNDTHLTVLSNSLRVSRKSRSFAEPEIAQSELKIMRARYECIST